MKTVTVVAGQTIELGYQYDNYATEVVFPSGIVTPFITNFGSSGTFAIWYRRSGDSLGYPIGDPLVTFDSSDNTITWQVVEADTANPGTAQVQLRYIVDEVCVMSQMFTGVVSDSVDVGTTVPEPMEQWADAILNGSQAGSLITEVQDIRLGYDGTEYPSAGDAVRNQIVQAMENGGGLSDDVKDALLQIAQKVAYIDDDGQTYYDDLYDALYPPATGVTLSASSWGSNTIGETYQLRATVAPSGWSGTVTWSSSNTSVATVSSTGLVTVVGYGLCIISATADSVSAPCRVSVTQLSVQSISAVFNQGSNKIYDTDDFETEIKKYLTVTATMSDASTQVLSSSAYGVNTTYLEGASTGNAQATYNQKTSEWFTFNVTEWLTSLTATYTQSGTVYDTDTLDSLKSDLVVTASYEDSSTATIASADYTLSGTLAEGTSTITVSYGGKTATFSVTVSSGYKLRSTFNSTGSEYIDTGVHLPTNGTVTIAEEFVITQFQTTGGSDIDYIFGTRQSTSDNSYMALQSNHKNSGNNQGKYLWGVGIGWSAGLNIIDTNQVIKIVHVITVSNNGLALSVSAHFKNVTAGTSQTFTNTYTTTSPISTNSIKIGNLFDSTGFIGTLNDFVIDDYEWTAEEISAFLAS